MSEILDTHILTNTHTTDAIPSIHLWVDTKHCLIINNLFYLFVANCLTIQTASYLLCATIEGQIRDGFLNHKNLLNQAILIDAALYPE